jgi:hypothetical protein
MWQLIDAGLRQRFRDKARRDVGAADTHRSVEQDASARRAARKLLDLSAG